MQLGVIFFFIFIGYIAFRSSKQDEQNRVWIGLAKETAHQLGTPTSSLLGWIEYLRSQPVDQEAVEEMNKDLTHLLKIVDRFSKIGSETVLQKATVNEVVGEAVMYFRKRIPRNVTLDYNGLAIAPIEANINPALFEWVVENLMKNALDALQGHGSIDVRLSMDDQNVMIDVKDTGKGIPKSNWKRIFEPGFTTKTRGWGLGLSLSRRIIEEYHNGKIAVVESEPGQGYHDPHYAQTLFRRMIRPDDLSVAADSLAANGTPDGRRGPSCMRRASAPIRWTGGSVRRKPSPIRSRRPIRWCIPQPPFRTLFRPRFRRWSRSRRPNGR